MEHKWTIKFVIFEALLEDLHCGMSERYYMCVVGFENFSAKNGRGGGGVDAEVRRSVRSFT